MSDFDTLRAALSQKRSDSAASQRKVSEVRERLKHAERTLADLERVRNEQDSGYLRRRQALTAEAAHLSATLAEERKRLGTLGQEASGLLGSLAALEDPADQVGRLQDSSPILLFPLRLETRFKTVTSGGATRPQLWVRVYPDDCQVDSFEELLSDAELRATRTFWVELWKAGGIESQERGAWRTLAGTAGSGRAAWLLQAHAPANAQQKPVKARPEDIVLVIIPELALTPKQEDAACAYWVRAWKADRNEAERTAALGALRDAVGEARAAEILERFAPVNPEQQPPPPKPRSAVDVTCAVLRLPPAPAATKTTSWTQAPRARALPDRFVLMAFNGGEEVKRVVGGPIPDGLAAGPDPSLPQEEQLRFEDGELVVNEDLRWLVDFDRAVAVGMGFRVDLTPQEAQGGFERLLVLGVRASASDTEGRALLETLLSHHHRSTHGFGLVPQGSPTNNTEGDGAAYSWTDDADTTFGAVLAGTETFSGDEPDTFERRDGAWLAEALGISPAVLQGVANAAGKDQAEARAMGVALWPATCGYMLEDMMKPLFSDEDIESTRRFFERYVSGRGPVPAVRVGRQPYGILPAMAFSRFEDRRGQRPERSYLDRLHGLLGKMDTEWQRLARDVAHVGKAGDPHQILLDIIGLHSGSVEYHQRYAEGLKQLYNKLVLQFGAVFGALLAGLIANQREQTLAQLGYTGPQVEPPILEKFFFGKDVLLTGPVVDDVPLSETAPVRAYAADGRNYLAWLASSPLETLRRQDFGAGKEAPRALLYLLLRHSLMLSQWDTGVRMLERRKLVDPAMARREPEFIHVQQQGPLAGESRFQNLYRAWPDLTGDDGTTLAEHVLKPAVLASAEEAGELREILRALDLLKGAPTARLERVLSEHLDCCTYRLDAWKSGFAALRLDELRRLNRKEGPGIYLGAYGWVEGLKPKQRQLTPARVPPELSPLFEKPGQPPLQVDSTNAGYIHAPSLDHAATAATLRNAYRVNASQAKPDTLAVNLSSERVRLALQLLEGIRQGQSLSALLGYRFERGLHDRHGLAEVDRFIYPLRQAFPLVADRLEPTKSDGKTPINLMEARNVIDGVRLLDHVREKGKTYPFGLKEGTGPGEVPPADPAQRTALNAEVDALLDLHDAVSDLVLAESTYQVVRGNFERSAANASVLGQGRHPPEPEVVKTPRSGRSLTHRVALHLDAAAGPDPFGGALPVTPRAKAEPALNAWLASRLPPPSDVACEVRYTSPALAVEKTAVVTQAQLGLQPVDLLYLAQLDLAQAMTELDGRILQHARYGLGADAHPALSVSIRYTQPVPGKVTFFELAPLLRSLRALLLKSRALTPADLALPSSEEAGAYTYDFAELEGRISPAVAALQAARDALALLEPDASDLDTYARKVSEAFLGVALHGVPHTGTGDIHEDLRKIYESLLRLVRDVTDRWLKQATTFDDLMAGWPTRTTDVERLALLLEAEAQVSASTTVAPPADPAVFRPQVEAKKAAFDAALAQLQGLLTLGTGRLVDFLSSVEAAAPRVATHDAVPFDLSAPKTAATALREELVARVKGLKEDLSERLTAAGVALSEAGSLEATEARVGRLLQAAVQVLGDEVRLLPRFQLSAPRAQELDNCSASTPSLLAHLKAEHQRRFPLDDWLYGLARVRDKLSHWENVTFLCEAFGTGPAELKALQLPFLPGDRWLGLELPADYVLDGERLLYTAHFASAFSGSAAQCGLLLDEWTELIPGKEETTGVAFHFDRPSTEPPQVMLLAVPPVVRGQWRWDDLTAMLHETLDAAKKRAVEPAQVDTTLYAPFLPATLMAVTLYQLTIATNLAFNNALYDVLRAGE
jgi:hypothetical protein